MTGYVMNSAVPEELSRLALLEAWADPGTIRCLEAAGIPPGAACLEVGAGAGSIARWLCERVGLEGTVLATDVDCGLISASGPPNLELRHHDIVTDPLPDCAFDLIHARMVLEHLPERAEVLGKLVAALKPGGRLVVEDQDIASVAPAGTGGAALGTQFMLRSSALVRLLTAAGMDLEFGRRLYGALRAESLAEIGVEGRVSFVVGGTPLARFWQLTWEQLRPKLIDSRLLSAWDIDEFLALLDDGQFVWMGPTIVAAWGSRPPRNA